MNFRATLRPLLVASALALAGVSAQAALVLYTGQIDSGPLAGSGFSGSFSHPDAPANFDGSIDLDSFTLDLAGQTFTLASADLPAVAWFAGGSFLGVDYVDLDSFSTQVQLTAGFFDLSEALLSYQVVGAAQGFGGFTGFTQVSEPATLASVLAGMALLGLSRRQRDRIRLS